MDFRPLTCFKKHLAAAPNAPFLHQPLNREWQTYSFSDVDLLARKFAAALQGMGLERGDRVAVFSKNCAEWIIADLGIMMAGMVSVPIYFSAAADTANYVLEHSGTRAIILGKLDDPSIGSRLNTENITTIGLPYYEPACDQSWESLLAATQPINEYPEVSDDDLLSIVYTSGSTGNPKGVMITFGNAQAIGVAAHSLGGYERSYDDRVVSYLPLAHIAERGLVEFSSIASGTQIYFVESLDTFNEDITFARPTIFFAVPRIWLKIQQQVLSKLPPKAFNILTSIPVLGGALKKALRKKLGLNDAQIVISGSAPIAPDILRWYHRLGINISEGWAMTETSCVGAINLPFNAEDIGTVGKVLSGTELKISAEGEVLIKGDCCTPGYYKNDEATKELFDGEWLRTGDLGTLTNTGALRIIGRIKEQFKTSKGKYVSPAEIENLIAASPMIEQVCVSGSGLPQPFALVVLAEGISSSEDALNALLEATNQQLARHEQLSHMYVLKQQWTIEDGLLTPTMKIKRSAIEAKFVEKAETAMASANTAIIFEN